VLHERVILLTVQVAEIPLVAEPDRIDIEDCGEGFLRVLLHYGFMEEPDVPRDLALIDRTGPPLNMMRTSFYLGRQKLIAAKRPGMALWREHLFALMMRSSESAMEFFRLPTNRVIELGSQLEI
jgi:KUP system potassium uptake protein